MFTNYTGGAQTALGSITYHNPGGNPASENQYSLTSIVTSDASGRLTFKETASDTAALLNGFVLAAVPPSIATSKALRLDFSYLVPNDNYQLQSSPDLAAWSNVSAPFTATANTNSQYVDVTTWNTYWRLAKTP